jgi:hypothetical protein
MEKRYEIGGNTYVQRPVVLGQLRKLAPLVNGIVASMEPSATGLLAALGGKMPSALAIVLIEDGADVREVMEEERCKERASFFEWTVDSIIAIEVVSDFFECNRASLLSEKLGSLTKYLVSLIPSKPSSSPLPEETSSVGTQSSGESPSPSPTDGSD